MEVEDAGAAAGGGGAKAAAAPLVTNLSSSDVQTKYREAATIANAVLVEVLAKLQPGALIADICAFGDAAILEATGKVYKTKKTMEKGIAFPTCISVNETVAHYSPFRSESRTLAARDAVKVDLGVHLDGYCAVVAHTVVLGASAAEPVTGPQADVIAAAHNAAEVALRLIKPGATNTSVTEAIEACAAAYGVKSMAAVQCSQMERFKLEGTKSVPLKKSASEGPYKVHKFEAHETYAVEIAFTTGEGKAREVETRTTVYKRQPEVKTQLKLAASRKLLNEVNQAFPTMPFSLRALALEERDARMGVIEPSKMGSLTPFPVIEEREGMLTAHFRFTLLLLPGGTLKVTGLDLPSHVTSDKALPPAVLAVRNAVVYVKPVKGASAAAAAAAAAAPAPGAAAAAGGAAGSEMAE